MNQSNTENTGSRGSDKPVVIITGSSGLIGTKLIDRMADEFQCIGLDKIGNPYPPENAELISFDITSSESIAAALERVRFAYGDRIASVIHLAAYHDFSGEPSPMYEEVNVKGSKKFIKALQDFDVEQFVFSSTNLIYKPAEPGTKIHEDCPMEPNWQYPESKVDTEKILRENRGDMKAVLLRLAGIYDDEGHSIPVGHQIQRIYEKEFTSYFYSGDTTHGNVFLHMDDLIDALEKTVKKRKDLPDEVPMNIGEPTTPSYEELQKRIGELVHGEEWQTFEVPPPLAKAGSWTMNIFGDPFIKPWMIDRADDHYELDISRAKKMLDWEPKHSLMDTLPKIIGKLKEDPLAWYEENNLEPPSDLKKKEKDKEA